MGRIVHLTEEQIKQFFGKGFGNRLLREGNPETDKFSRMATIPGKKLDAASSKYVKGMNNPNTDTDAQSSVGFNYTSREGKDLPGYGGAVAKMGDFGAADLTNDNVALNNNRLLDEIKQLHGDGPLNLLDVLDILHQLKGKRDEKEKTDGKDSANEAFDFLNTVDIDYILSNFLTINAPDYVYWRLKALKPEEIKRIRDVYGRDFSNFGQRCDGCGVSVWKTTVSPFTHDDAHINLEYMGGEAGTNTSGFAKVNEDTSAGRRFYTFYVPFQIHHMNENPGDNSPLNLSCLCPNCHAITGSYGRGKNEMDNETFKILGQLEDMLGGESGVTGSLTDLMDPKEKSKIVKALKSGEFERRSTADTLMGTNVTGSIALTIDDISPDYLRSCGIDDIEGFIKGFNKYFEKVYNAGFNEYTEYHKLLKEEEETDKKDDEEEENKAQSENDVVSKDKVEIAGIKVMYEVRNTGNKILLMTYIGEPPFIFSAFKNNAIALTPLYYSYEPGNPKYDRKILEIRNQVLGSVLNAMKMYNKAKMSNWSDNLAMWASNKNGTQNMSAISGIKPGSQVRIDPESGKLLTGIDDNGKYVGYGDYEDLDTLYQGRDKAKSISLGRDSKVSKGIEAATAAKKQSTQKQTITNVDILTNGINNENEKSITSNEKVFGKEIVNDLLNMKHKLGRNLTVKEVDDYLRKNRIQFDIPKKNKK